ncbi:carbohydrate ABC transporter permease [Cohnella sp. WQ 127256]|uniref:carbohydrate ABC transporter permease n=1 Tax=Cohnella sp. WQ 127256 TaxID=2938790 RepID=UPI0021175D61|nr:carbohydrate ABC transporter permease [Cohnella sp. WQ 127256]
MKKGTKWLWELLSVVCIAIISVPLYFVIINSFKTKSEAADMNLALPGKWNIVENIKEVFASANIPQAFWNTTVITFVSVLLIIILCSISAFVIQRRDTRLTKIITQILIIGLILPMMIITTYYVVDFFDLVRTYSGVILLFIAGNFPFVTYLYISFMHGIPRDLDEAAVIDGAGRYRLFFGIIFPLLLPVNASVLILTSMNIWNDFTIPFYFLNSADNYTLSLLIYFFFGQKAADWNLVFTTILIVSLPVILLYLFLQRYIVAGMTSGAVKS